MILLIDTKIDIKFYDYHHYIECTETKRKTKLKEY